MQQKRIGTVSKQTWQSTGFVLTAGQRLTIHPVYRDVTYRSAIARAGDEYGTPTGISIQAGQYVALTASGRWSIDPQPQYWTSPGDLLANLGSGGSEITVGGSWTGQVSSNVQLRFRKPDDPGTYWNNVGSLQVDVYVGDEPITTPSLSARIGVSESGFAVGQGFDDTITGGGELYLLASGSGRVGAMIFVDAPDQCENDGDCAVGVFTPTPIAGNPIQIQTGTKVFQAEDLQLVTLGSALTFRRYYHQGRVKDSLYQLFWPGWSHNHRYLLVLNSSTNPKQAIIHQPDGGRLILRESTTDVYLAGAGASATLDKVGDDYRLTTHAEQQYLFDGSLSYSAGGTTYHQLKQQLDSNGNMLTYSHDTSTGRLLSVEDDYNNALQFAYDSNGKLHTVTGYANQVATPQKIMLSFVQSTNLFLNRYQDRYQLEDVRGTLWYFDHIRANAVGGNEISFDDGFLVGRSVQSGTSELILERLRFDYETGKGITYISQETGGILTSQFQFVRDSSGKVLSVIESREDRSLIHQFANGVYAGLADGTRAVQSQTTANSYRSDTQLNANENLTELAWSADGARLEGVTDALGQPTAFSYNPNDTLALVEDAEGRTTEYTYGDSANPRQPTRIRVMVPDSTTVLRWQTFSYDSRGRVLTEALLDAADGVTVLQQTSRTYTNGRLESVTVNDLLDPSNDQSTTYSYDAVGRVVKTNRSSLYGTCTFNYSVYDAAGNVLVRACSRHNLSGAIIESAIDGLLTTYPETDTNITKYTYDALGRRISTTSDAGKSHARTSRTIYDGLGRVIRMVSHFVAGSYAAPAGWVFENGVWKDAPSGTTISHGVDGDQNLVSDTAYNRRGQVRLSRDLFGVVTLYGYDLNDRLVKTIGHANQVTYNNDTSGDIDLNSYVPVNDGEHDRISSQTYDAVGNLVKTVGPLGHTTFTVYDALNRPVKVVRNATPNATVAYETDSPSYSPYLDPRSDDYAIGLDPDRDQIETTTYDTLGRVIRTQRLVENRFGAEVWETMLYGYDALGRQVKTVQFASQPTYNSAADPDLSNYSVSSDADQDLVTETVYDPQGRVRYTLDVNGVKQWTVYDGLGRTIRSIQNATETGGSPESMSYVGNLSDPAADLMSETEYDSDGRVKVSRRVLRTNTAGTALEWLTTLYGYDELGRQVRVIQNAAHPTYFTSYPLDVDLSSYATNVGLSTASDTDILSTTIYDARGRVVKTIDRRGNVTLHGYDDSGRRVKTVVNASNPNGSFAADLSDYVGSNPTPDQDRISSTVYGLGGRVVSTTDAAGNVTRFVYDLTGRRIRTVGNYMAQGTTDPADWEWVNNRWEDGAGNPISHGTTFDHNHISDTTYNVGGQVIASRDPRGTRTTLAYDGSGRRLTTTQAQGTLIQVTSYTVYDKAGRVRRMIANYIPNGTSPDLVSNGAWLFNPSDHGTNDDQNLIVAYAYDQAGRQIQVADPVGNTTSTTYRKDGSVIAVTDAEATQTVYRYDALRRRTRVVAGFDPQSTDPAAWAWNTNTTQWEVQ